ncbi:MAG: Gfo/Idh/MocA family oxidoreductase [Clostridia bacterium]|nr:Gfo/Idh/MocA family oxidoreductase [Clostridia bacterium]
MIRWGIVGPGKIANKFADAIKNVEGAELIAVASRLKERGQEFADKHNVPMVFESYEKMSESSDVDAVYVATPHPFHKSCAELFLNAKKHVLCEKPVCVNEVEAVELMEYAKNNGVFLMEAMWTRFLPAINETLKIVQSGEIGDIRGVKADFCYSMPYNAQSRVYNPDLAGGALLDVGVYCLNFAAIFLGDEVEDIISMSDVNYGVDCQTNVLLKYSNGRIASLSSAVNVRKPNTGYIYGTKGFISLPNFYAAQEIIVNVNNSERRILKPFMGNGFEEEIIEACSCIRDGKMQSNIMPMKESIRIMKQMDLIRNQIGLRYPFEL